MVWEVVSHSASSEVKSEVVMTPQDFHMMGTLWRSLVSFHGLGAGDGTEPPAGKRNSQGPVPALIGLGGGSGQDQSFGNRARHGVVICGALLAH